MKRAKIEFALAGALLALAILTALVPSWIEALFKFEPDGGTGELEWLIVGFFGALAVVAALVGRKHHRIAATNAQSELVG